MARDERPVIERRDIHFGVGEHLTPTWMKGDPALTAVCDAMSMLFPDGERFFIRSVTPYLDQLDPALQKEVRAFIIQEALHTREHEAYNRALAERGADVLLMEGRAAATLARAKAQITKLAVTVAIEHLTATLAHVVLADPSLFADVPAPLRDLWTWHSLEEMEHKGVAFDVFMAVTADWPAWKRYGLRCLAMLQATRMIMPVQAANEATILLGRGYRVRRVRRFWLLFGSPGLYRRGLGYYFRFFRPGFHPWETSEDESAAEWRQRFHTMTERAS